MLAPGAPVAAIYQSPGEQLNVFVVDTEGALHVVSKSHNGPWASGKVLAPSGFTAPAASVAAVHYSTYGQLEAFVVDTNGNLNVVWMTADGAWHQPVGLFSGFPTGAPLTVCYQPHLEQLHVLVVDNWGALNVISKDHNSKWKPPRKLTPNGFAAVRSHLASAYYRTYDQLEVFVVDSQRTFNVIWKAQDHDWWGPHPLAPDFASAGAPLTAVYQPLDEHLEVLGVDDGGSIKVIRKDHNGNWKAPAGIGAPGQHHPAAAAMAAVYYRPNQQIDVLFVDSNEALSVIWKEHNGPWQGPVGITEPHFVPAASVAAVYCQPFDQVEAFTVKADGVLIVEWKVRNKKWVPCPFPLLGTPRVHIPFPIPSTMPTVLDTERVGQLTGSPDPNEQNPLPSLNATSSPNWKNLGFEGTDLGANTYHDQDKRLYIFFGDTVPGGFLGSPARDTDLVAWTEDTELRPGGFNLTPVRAANDFYDPFTIAGIGTLPIGRTPTGAFSYGSKVYVVAIYDDIHDPVFHGSDGPYRFPTTVVTSKDNPSKPGPFDLEFVLSKSTYTGAPGKVQVDEGARFWQVAPVVVKNAEHRDLPASEGDGLVLLGTGLQNKLSVAWMRLDRDGGPQKHTIRYYTGNPEQRWTPEPNDAATALKHEQNATPVAQLPGHYTSVSAAWLHEVGQWVVVYSLATNDKNANPISPAGPVVARFGPNPWTWSDEVPIFKPCRDKAYGNFMHWSGIDSINTRVPPAVWGDEPGWAYGAFLLQPFTKWNADSRELTLVYLMSTSNPYQVQVMRTRLRMPAPKH